MVWNKCIFKCCIGLTLFFPGHNQNISNLAWELIQGFVPIWNQTGQVTCVAFTSSSAEGLKFAIISLNLTKTLENELKNLHHMGGKHNVQNNQDLFS